MNFSGLHSLRAKVTLMMLLLAIPLLIFISLFIFQMRIEAARYQKILYNNASINRAAQQTINAAQVANQAMYKVISISDPKNLQETMQLGKVFQGALINFDLFTQALIYGSNSEDFKNSKNGINFEQWKRRGFYDSIEVIRPEPLIRKKAMELVPHYKRYTKIGQVIIANTQQALLLELKGKHDEAERKREEAYEYLAQLVDSETDFQQSIGELFSATEMSTAKARDEIERSLKKRIRYLVLTGLLCFLIAISMAWHFCNHFIIKALLDMNESVDHIIKGRWDDKLEIMTDDEIGRLAGNFNRMVDKLKTTLVSKDLLMDEVRERKRTEKLIEKLKRRLELILNSAGEGIFGIDNKGEITFANPAAAQLLGWDIESIVGRDVYSTVLFNNEIDKAPEAKENHPIFLCLHKGLEQRVMDGVYYDKNAGEIYVEYVVKPIHQNKAVTGAVICFSDISNRKKLESQLLQSQRMESVGRLAGGVAHDFNNLLMVIRGNCDFLRASLEPNDKRMEDVEEIEKASQRALVLTDHLLNFSRHQLTDSREVQINEVVEKMSGLLQATIGNHIKMILKLSPRLSTIKTNLAQFEDIFLNLASNAKEAMIDGGVFCIETFNQVVKEGAEENWLKNMPPGNYVAVKVSDSGTGIGEDIKSQIFEPFFTTKKSSTNRGLGLATVYGAMKQNNAYIHVESQKGKGTVFYLYFECFKESPKVKEPVNVQSTATGELEDNSGTEAILLVEDEDALRKFVARGLRSEGYTVYEAANGLHAMKEIKKIGVENIDLVLTDMVMPRMGGRELCINIRTLRPDIKLILMSGYTDDALVRKEIVDEGIPFLQKPVSIKELTAKVRKVLDGKAGAVKK